MAGAEVRRGVSGLPAAGAGLLPAVVVGRSRRTPDRSRSIHPSSRTSRCLNNPLRRWWSPPGEVLAWANLAPGQQVLEVGPGPGYFTPYIVQRVASQGRVIALEINPVLLRRALAAVEWTGMAAWGRGVQANALTIPLRDESMDRALLITVLGEVPEPAALFRELYRVLRPGGAVLVVEEWVDAGFSSLRQVVAWSTKAGFTPVECHGRPWRYALLLRKGDN